jgi:hypothetical protein
MAAWRIIKPALTAAAALGGAFLTARELGRAAGHASQGDMGKAARSAASSAAYAAGTAGGRGRDIILGSALSAGSPGSDSSVRDRVGSAMSVEEAMDALMLDRLPHHERITQMNLIAQNVPELAALDDALDIYQAADGYGSNTNRIRATLTMNSGNIPLLNQLFRYVYKTLRETKKPISLSELLASEGMNDEAEMVARGVFNPAMIRPPGPVGYRPDISRQAVNRAGRAAQRDYERQRRRAAQFVTEGEVRRLVREMIIGNTREM